MDPQAYLMNQGWSGPGNPLNPSRRPGAHGGLGLTKPILVARKKNTHGVGKKTTHDHTNQWWLRGFEAALRGIGTDGNVTPVSEESTPETPKSELYKFFVRGPGLAGTIKPYEYNQSIQSRPDGDSPPGPVDTSTSNRKLKRKREDRETSPTADSSQGGKEKKNKKKDKKRSSAFESQVACGIATPPEEESHEERTHCIETVEPVKEDISKKKKRKKEEKREKKRLQAEALASEIYAKLRTSDQSSDESSQKKERERKGASKKARLEEKPGRKGKREKNEKKEKREKRERKEERKAKKASKDE
ncbi:hypothetical protein MGYG_01528 [Nannizzia gypsea CBS 118893]|uniref:G-patch domain-containing protein n=1 Tax=Arthroderma gypseum (strain ATCC MYA-4604 / CBS 118893) TaxID=535722 RepID=E5R1G5_ARTGP|nr:hypothetical protein MGYG_01528 [Nannizzia gypsea CBS 118893]EFQ98501.1 hypothetical protein MGYG_01528 [Nannizzia gypsea CBS 118893]